MGRYSALKIDDITCRFPSEQPILTSLCEIGRIAEASWEDMYAKKTESLRSLYAAAQRAHTQLRQLAEKAGIGAGDISCGHDGGNGVAALHLHNCRFLLVNVTMWPHADRIAVYYHAVLVIFRPFLIAETLAYTQQKHGVMWLREACRHAVNAAQDSLVYINERYSTLEDCKVSRRRYCDSDLVIATFG